MPVKTTKPAAKKPAAKKVAAKTAAKKTTTKAATKPAVKKSTTKTVSTKKVEEIKGIVINGKMTFPEFLKAFQNRYPYLGVEVMYSKTGHFLNDTSDPISANNSSVEVVIHDTSTIDEVFEQFAKNYGVAGSVFCRNSKGYIHFYGTFRKTVPIIEINDLCKVLGCKNKPK